MFSASQYEPSRTSATLSSPLATRRLRPALAKRTSFALWSACMYCGPGAILAVALITPPAVRSCRRTASSLFVRQLSRAQPEAVRPWTGLSRYPDRPMVLSSDRPGALTPVRRCDAAVKLRHNSKPDQVHNGKTCARSARFVARFDL